MMNNWTTRTLDQTQIKKSPSTEEMRKPVVVQPGESAVVSGVGEVFNHSTSPVTIDTDPERK